MVDVWSAGVVLYAMLYGNFPFKAANVEELESLIIAGNYTLPVDISEEARDLISQILQPNPQLRLTIPEVLEHTWMKVVDENRMVDRHDYEIVSIFTPEEMEAIRNEYSFKEKAKEDSLNDEASSSVFTEHNLDTTENDVENDPDLSKSTILAPFNSIEPNAQEFVESVLRLVQSKRIIKFHSKLREIDRRYERNNNSQLDNGVYVQPVGGASPKGFAKAQASGSSPSTPGQLSPKISDNKLLQPFGSSGKGTITTAQSFYSTTLFIGTSVLLFLDQAALNKMEKMGYEKTFVAASLTNNELNNATTLYYLLTKN